MPFFKNAKFELVTDKPVKNKIKYEIRYEPLPVTPNESSYFHATYKDIPKPELGKDLIFLDTKGIEGHDNWSGNFVGNSFIFSHNGYLGTLEGDPRFFFDDSKTPQAYGTGTEEWGGGGDYWGGQNMSLALAGHPCGAPAKKDAKDDRDLIESGYRFLLADLMPFGKRAEIHFEHGGENLSLEHYEAVTYWYGLPTESLIKTDSIDIGNIASEKEHHYLSPGASKVETINSRYEWGIDHFPSQVWGADAGKAGEFKDKTGTEIFPVTSEDGRYHRSFSEFTINIDPENIGVLLRRKLDYSFPNQTAEVYISATDGKEKWEKAGIWYLAGSNTALYSDPPGELEPQISCTETSNRRFRDDEFMISERLTKHKSAIKIKIKFIPNQQTLFTDFPFPKQSAWSELKYDVYSFIKPNLRLTK